MSEDRSWIKVYRSMMDKPAIWNSPTMVRLWLFCLFSANWKEVSWTIPGTYEKIQIPRGAFPTGRNALHAKLYPSINADGFDVNSEKAPSPSTLWRKLHGLEKLGCILIRTLNNRCSLVSICNYDSYQNVNSDIDPVFEPPVDPVSARQPPANRPVSDTLLRIKEIQEGKKERKDAGICVPENMNEQEQIQLTEEQLRRELQSTNLTFPTAIGHHRFDDCYQAYPRHVKRKEFIEACEEEDILWRARGNDGFHDFLLGKVKRFSDSPAGTPDKLNGDVIPHGDKWIKGRRWEDSDDELQRSCSKATKSKSKSEAVDEDEFDKMFDAVTRKAAKNGQS